MHDGERVTTTVTLLDMIPGDPPTIITFERLAGRDGRTKPFTQKVPVPDAALFQALLAGAAKGDEIEITTVTDWSAPGLPTYVTAFAVIRKVQEVGTE
jgi:hypothetical protein